MRSSLVSADNPADQLPELLPIARQCPLTDTLLDPESWLLTVRN